MTLVIRSLPDLSAGAARRRFTDRVREESAIVYGSTRDATSVAGEGALCLRAALDGREEVLVGRYRLAVDDDVFLVLNPQTVYATRIRAEHDVFSFSVHFAEAMVAEVIDWRQSEEHRLLDRGECGRGATVRMAENLRPHDRLVSPVLRYLMFVCRARECDALWYDEQVHFLLERLVMSHQAEQARVTHLRAVRARTRREIHRRIARATDFILSNYEAPLDLKSMAEVACLEKHHFLKLFSMVHGITPFEFLRRKRLAVALRLLRHSTRSHGDIARLAGLGTRHTLLRALKEFTGNSPQEYKRVANLEASGWHGELARLLEMRREPGAPQEAGGWLFRPATRRDDLTATVI